MSKLINVKAKYVFLPAGSKIPKFSDRNPADFGTKTDFYVELAEHEQIEGKRPPDSAGIIHGQLDVKYDICFGETLEIENGNLKADNIYLYKVVEKMYEQYKAAK